MPRVEVFHPPDADEGSQVTHIRPGGQLGIPVEVLDDPHVGLGLLLHFGAFRSGEPRGLEVGIVAESNLLHMYFFAEGDVLGCRRRTRLERRSTTRRRICRRFTGVGGGRFCFCVLLCMLEAASTETKGLLWDRRAIHIGSLC